MRNIGKRLRFRLSRKEQNKLIERTAKCDAYQQVAIWGAHVPESDKNRGDALWYAQEKIRGHQEWLAEHLYYYDYAHSKFFLKPVLS